MALPPDRALFPRALLSVKFLWRLVLWALEGVGREWWDSDPQLSPLSLSRLTSPPFVTIALPDEFAESGMIDLTTSRGGRSEALPRPVPPVNSQIQKHSF